MSYWQPIETAPKDQIIILYRPNAPWPAIKVAPGKYNNDEYAKKPKPFWEIWLCIWNGKTVSRNYEPTHWQPLPEPPVLPTP
jgi:hypothetical protein